MQREYSVVRMQRIRHTGPAVTMHVVARVVQYMRQQMQVSGHVVAEKCAEKYVVMLAVQHQSAERKEQACAVITKSEISTQMQAERNIAVQRKPPMR